MTEIKLPWPPTQLSPNSRLHWTNVARAKKIYRHACWVSTLEQIKGSFPHKEGSNIRLELEFFKPTRRDMDRDNLLARMKSGIDGMSDALKVNDRVFQPISISVSDEIGGYVRVRIFNTGEI